MKRVCKLAGVLISLSLIMVIFQALNVFAATPQIQKLITYKNAGNGASAAFDVDGDGRKDTIKLIYRKNGQYDYNGLIVQINGKNKLSVACPDLISAHMDGIVLENGRRYLYIKWHDPYDDGMGALYYMNNNKLLKAYDFTKMVKTKTIPIGNGYKTKSPAGIDQAEPVKVNGNRIDFFGLVDFKAIGLTYLNVSLVPGKDGSLKRSSNYCTICETAYGRNNLVMPGKYYKLNQKVYLYKKPNAKKVRFTVRKGTKVKLSKVYFGNKAAYVKVTTKSGKSGWLNLYMPTKNKVYQKTICSKFLHGM